MDIPLLMVLEFAILLGYDGQLEQNSDMEKELFTSAIDQLKERFHFITLLIFVRSSFLILLNQYDFESLAQEYQNDKAGKRPCLAVCKNMG